MNKFCKDLRRRGRFTGFTNCGDYYVDNVLAKAPNSAGWRKEEERTQGI